MRAGLFLDNIPDNIPTLSGHMVWHRSVLGISRGVLRHNATIWFIQQVLEAFTGTGQS